MAADNPQQDTSWLFTSDFVVKVRRQARTCYMGIPWYGAALLQKEKNYLAKAASTWIYLYLALWFKMCFALTFQTFILNVDNNSMLEMHKNENSVPKQENFAAVPWLQQAQWYYTESNWWCNHRAWCWGLLSGIAQYYWVKRSNLHGKSMQTHE